MTTPSTDNATLKNRLNAASPDTIADALRALGFGNILRALTTHLARKAPAADPYNLAAVLATGLPEDGRAAVIHRAYARAGGVTGELAVAAANATPSTGQIAVSPNGEIVTLATDVITDLDVVYEPAKYDVVEMTLNVVSDTATVPAGYTAAPKGVLMLLEAESLVGGVTGKFIVVAPSDSKPGATKEACLKVAKDKVLFKASDAVTQARLKFAVVPAKDVDALLTAPSATL